MEYDETYEAIFSSGLLPSATFAIIWPTLNPALTSLRRSLGEDVGHFFAHLEGLRRTKLYDLFAAMPIIGCLLVSAAQIVQPLIEQTTLAIFFFKIDPSALPTSMALNILSKVFTLAYLSALVVMFAVRRLPTDRAQGIYPRFVAFAGTFSPMSIVALEPQELSPMLQLTSLGLIIGGMVIALSAVFGLGRSISLIPEARKLITGGPYALVRHPLYVGEMVAMSGLAMQFIMPWALLLLGLNCLFQIERARSEERLLLLAFPDYPDYIVNTARFLPGVW